MLHESTESAAARRLRFELGIGGVDLTFVLPDFRYRAEKDGVVENEICPVLVGCYDGNIDPNPTEVANVRWVDWDEFVASVNGPDPGISPWAVDEVRLLTTDETFNQWFARNIPAAVTTRAPVC
jgi:isopentenyldiphosphate isomerase